MRETPRRWSLVQTSAPALEPVTLAEAKRHCKVDTVIAEDDGLIQGLVSGARQHVETWTRRQLVTATFRLSLDRFPRDGYCWADRGPPYDDGFWGCGPAEHGAVRLPRAPLQAVAAVAYDDTGGSATTLDSAQYQVDTDSEPGRLQPAYGCVWPLTRPQLNAVRITYRAGWAHTAVALAITAGTRTVTPASMSGITAGASVEVDTGTALEVVTVASVTSSTFTATFASDHGAGAVVSRVPRPLKQAVLLLVGHWYRFRGDDGRADAQATPPVFEALVSSWWTGECR